MSEDNFFTSALRTWLRCRSGVRARWPLAGAALLATFRRKSEAARADGC